MGWNDGGGLGRVWKVGKGTAPKVSNTVFVCLSEGGINSLVALAIPGAMPLSAYRRECAQKTSDGTMLSLVLGKYREREKGEEKKSRNYVV